MAIIIIMFLLIVAFITILVFLPKNVRLVLLIIVGSFFVIVVGIKCFVTININSGFINDFKERTRDAYVEELNGYYIIKSYEEFKKYVDNSILKEYDYSNIDASFFDTNDLVVYVHPSTRSTHRFFKSGKSINVIYHMSPVHLSTEIATIEVKKNSVKRVKEVSDQAWWWQIYEFELFY